MKTRTITRLSVVALAAFALAGCAPTVATDAEVPAAAVVEADSVTINDAWVKSAEEGMSAAFGVLTNEGDEDVTIVSATSEASSMLELHETVEDDAGQMVMQQKEGGFVIPAGGTFTLEPGANHIMLMDLTAPLAAGDEATFTLVFDDGSEYTFTAPAKDYTGADETYVGGDMDMGDGE